MISLLELLRARGLDSDVHAKMVRHEDARYHVPDLLREHLLDEYQAYQSRPVFAGCDVVISFIARPQRRALLHGVYRVNGFERCTSGHRRRLPHKYQEWASTGHIYYHLTRMHAFAPLEGRVVVDWGLSTRSWHQWLRDREVVEVLPKGFVAPFPGYEEVLLSFDDLARILHEEAGNRVWHRMLAAVSAVYLIVDQRTGKQCVGLAAGDEGLLQRWMSYIQSGHGGNKLLRQLVGDTLEYRRNFTFSILQTFPRVTPLSDVLAAEALHKAKLGTRAHGLNDN